MRLEKFKKLIDKAEDFLLESSINDCCGVCRSLKVGFFEKSNLLMRHRVVDAFNFICSPRGKRNQAIQGVDRREAWWLGDTSKKNLPRRIDTLRFFEQYCITEELYKDF